MPPKHRSYPVRGRLFHALCNDPDPDELSAERLEGQNWYEHLAADERFFDRMPADLSFQERSVLDYGCGAGHTCVFVAQRGACRVLGVDIQSVEFARTQVAERYPEVSDRIEFRRLEAAGEISDERFDVVLSKNAFEHVENPQVYVADMARLLEPDGELVIGFSALWKSPYGGHVQYMTKLPWAHLLFPERVVLRERKRFRPDEEPASYEEVQGGLNKMTLGRFRRIMAASGLEPTYFAVNRNDRPIAKALDALGRIPGLKEYFAFSVHSVWRHSHERVPAVSV
jgi:2-polyprenyl-3-methyl-5-hydroxy-6-metoxy-1,4-benzoquinol methylase